MRFIHPMTSTSRRRTSSYLEVGQAHGWRHQILPYRNEIFPLCGYLKNAPVGAGLALPSARRHVILHHTELTGLTMSRRQARPQRLILVCALYLILTRLLNGVLAPLFAADEQNGLPNTLQICEKMPFLSAFRG